jgi:hypothetical protein
MEPKELAEKFKAKAAAETTNKEAAQAALDRERADIGKADDAVKTAFEKVVVPYLNECRAAFPPNQFVFAIFQSDANDSRPLGVSFKIGKGLEVKITSTVGRIKVNTSGSPFADRGGFVDTGSFIRSVGDLTRENLSRLVELMVDGLP